MINKKGEYHETYDTTRACGYQASSKKKTMPAIAFGKASRDYKTGYFKDAMATMPSRIRI